MSFSDSVSLQAGWSSRYRPLKWTSECRAFALTGLFCTLYVFISSWALGQPYGRCALGLEMASVCI